MRQQLTLQQINERKPPESKLTAIEHCGKRGNLSLVSCLCECGNTKITPSYYISCGWVISCGCYKRPYGHGLSKHPIYKLWAHVKERCYNPKYKKWNNYGGKGVVMCDNWKNNFMEFYKWALDNGWEKGLEIDRIDSNGNYEPENCRFVTKIVNLQNKPDIIMLEYDNKKMNIYEWAKLTGLTSKLIYERVFRLKWSVEKALTTSTQKIKLKF